MKYKVGDRVIVGHSSGYCSDLRSSLHKTNYISTVKQIKSNGNHDYYVLEDLGDWHWQDCHIEGLAPEPAPEPEIITTRFELMDL